MQARSASKENGRIPCLRCGLSCGRPEHLSHPCHSRAGGAARRVSRAYAGVLACISRQNGSNLDGFVMTF